jgi:hypothetical protein
VALLSLGSAVDSAWSRHTARLAAVANCDASLLELYNPAWEGTGVDTAGFFAFGDRVPVTQDAQKMQEEMAQQQKAAGAAAGAAVVGSNVPPASSATGGQPQGPLGASRRRK